MELLEESADQSAITSVTSSPLVVFYSHGGHFTKLFESTCRLFVSLNVRISTDWRPPSLTTSYAGATLLNGESNKHTRPRFCCIKLCFSVILCDCCFSHTSILNLLP